MSRYRSVLLGLLAALCCQLTSAQYNTNMFLNGEYQNGIKGQPDKVYAVNPAANIFLQHAIISREAAGFQGPIYLPPEQRLDCGNGQQCVLNGQCQSGYFTQQLPKLQNCKSTTHVCCTYRAPPTTTERPYKSCQKDYDCVPTNLCNRGEIDSPEYVQKSTPGRCYAPDVCCRLPSTTLTVTGYLFRTPENPFVTPTRPSYTQPPNQRATTPRREYIPPAPTTPRREYIPPAPTTPAPTQPPYRPQPTTQTPYRPQPTTQPPYRPQPTTPRLDYLPPTTSPRGTPPPYRPQPTTQPGYRPQPNTQSPYRPQPNTQTPYRPQPNTQTPYRPQPNTQTPYRPQPNTQTPYRPQPITPERDYLPPADHHATESSNTISRTETPRPNGRQPTPPPSQYQPRPTPPRRGEGLLSPQIFPPISVDRRQVSKCASALECTPENMCNNIGVIVDQPVELTPMEAAFRVPLTDCQLEGGAPGKCCRDANYVDPWPINLAGVCATRNSNTSPKGIQDFDANFGEIPWQTMILKESTKTLVGGGALIGDQIVLTSASVVKGLAVNDVKIKAGEWELGRDSEPLSFQIVGAKSIDIHPEYNPSTGANDMAVIRLDRRLEFAQHIKPICVSNEDPKPNEKCVITGWGQQALKTHEEGAIMHVSNTNPVARSACGADDTSVCSSTVYDACQFDVGSALACGSGSSVMLKGIYAAENACGEGQTVRFSKPDLKWVNGFFTLQNKDKLLKRRV